eukprot:GDKI01039876.1.p1 GENE.GDKI01039876.1~~GDKI01039876.1.p1  ORF type:complete len:333 (+),score=50.29 GDKI01039876.1:89-1087(+)
MTETPQVLSLNVGGRVFAVKRSVLTAVEDSMLAARFGGVNWNVQQEERDEKGNIKVKGVRGDLFAVLLHKYLENAAVEREFELKRTPHPIVEGHKAAEYIEMLCYLGMETEAEEAGGMGTYTQLYDAFDPSRVVAPLVLLEGGRSAAVTPDAVPRNAHKTVYGRNRYAAGTAHTWRLQLASLQEGESVTDFQLEFFREGEETHSACINIDFSHGLEDGVTLSCMTPGVLDKTLPGCEPSMFENAIVDFSVDCRGLVTMKLVGGDNTKKPWVCGTIPNTNGWYRLCVWMATDWFGVQVTIMPPQDAVILNIDEATQRACAPTSHRKRKRETSC